MVKSVKVNDNQEIELSNNVGWAYEYREQFGHDIVPDLLPILSAIISLLGDADLSKLDIKKISKIIKMDTVQDALIQLTGLQFVDFLNLVWALNKTADEKIPLPKKWVKQFDSFELDIVAPEVFNLLVEGLFSRKNLNRLKLAEAEE